MRAGSVLLNRRGATPHGSSSRALMAAVATILIAPVLAVVGTTGSAAAAASYIEPGVQMVTAGAQCTANFVFTDKRGRKYVGYAAHCAGKGESTDTNGCTTPSRQIGARVRFVKGMSETSPGTTIGYGRLAYSSWRSMQRTGITGVRCRANDFALVRVEAAYVRKVRSSVPHWGGPIGLGAMPDPGARVFSYGSSSLRPGILPEVFSPKTGTVVESSAWQATVFTPNPGIPGDSGSGYLNARGRAVGVLSTINLAPLAGSNGVGSLLQQVRYARAHGFSTLRLVPGRTPFHA